MAIHSYPQMSMDIHGCPWISMDIHGYPWTSMDIHGYPWISMDIHVYPWTSMDIHIHTTVFSSKQPKNFVCQTEVGSLECKGGPPSPPHPTPPQCRPPASPIIHGKSMENPWDPWVPMGPHGFPWVPVGSHGFPWDPMGSPWPPLEIQECRKSWI